MGTDRLAAELRAEAARQRLSHREVARRIDRPATTVSRWMRGETPMTIDEVELLSDAIGLGVVDLVARAYAAPPPPPQTPRKRASGATLPRLDSNQEPAGVRRPGRGFRLAPLAAVA